MRVGPSTLLSVGLAALLVVLAAGLGVGTIRASKPGGGSLTTTIALSDQTVAVASVTSGSTVSGDVAFAVTRSIPYDRETIWVTNKCWDANGNLVVRIDAVVLWGTSVSLDGTTNPVPSGGTHCTAYVTLRPWQDRPLGDAIMDYSVAP